MNAKLALTMFSTVCGLAAVAASSATNAWSRASTLHTIAEANDLSDEDFMRSIPFEFSGLVVYARDASTRAVVLRDNTGYSSVLFERSHSLRRGDVAQIRGHTKYKTDSSHVRDLVAEEAHVIGKADVPEAVDTTVESLLRNDEAMILARVRGTITDSFTDEIDARWTFFTLRDGRSAMLVALLAKDGNGDFARSLVDAKVEITGSVRPGHAGFRRFIGPFLDIWDKSYIRILEPAPKDPFSLPELPDMKSFRPDRVAAMGRRTADGEVLAAWHGERFLLRRTRGQVIRVSVADGSPLPRAGDSVKVVGYPQTDLYRINFVRAIWRVEPGSAAGFDAPEDVSPRTILLDDSGRQMIKPNYHGRLVRMRGVVRALPPEAEGEKCLYVDCDGFLVPVDVSSNMGVVDGLEIGCRIEATGVCVLESQDWHPDMVFPKIDRMLLVPRSPSDVRVTERPPWWTPTRLLAIVFALVVATVAVLIWNWSLRRLVERRSNDLLIAEMSKKSAELRIDERTRLAADLHDTLAQNLTGISMQMSAAKSARMVAPEEEAEHLAAAEALLLSSRHELRRCIWDLRSEALDEPDFTKAIRETVRPVLRKTSLEVMCSVPRSFFTDTTAHTILSILRELSANAAVHGEAANISISGAAVDGNVRFTVEDDGAGFNPSHALGKDEGHFGLASVHERVKRLGGKFEIASTPGQGTTAIVELPQEKTT